MSNNQVVWEAALKYIEAGLEVVPDHPEEKFPKGYPGWQTRDFDLELLEKRILNEGWHIGIRNIEGLDFDNNGNPNANILLHDWKDLVDKECPSLVDKLLIERTRRGGFHVAWKCKKVGKPKKLAWRLPIDSELEQDPSVNAVVLIETKGKGGQFVVSPSPGYTLLQGSWENLNEITLKERKVLLKYAKVFDKLPENEKEFEAFEKDGNTGDRPGDIFNRDPKSINEAFELLLQAGWSAVYERNDAMYLRRPGKDEGISATYGYIAPGIFYNFSSNGAPFDINKAYNPFQIYTLLKYGDSHEDFSKAASELAERYGITVVDRKTNNNERMTDTSNAEEIAELYGDNLRFDHNAKRWLVWGEHRWIPDSVEKIKLFAIKAAREKQKEALKIEDHDKRKAIINMAISRESSTKITAAISILKSLPPVSDDGSNWDLNPWLLACKNGVVDLKTGTLRDGRPEDRITMTTGIDFDQNANCPRWEQFVDEVMMGRDHLKKYLQKSLGYSITGDMSEQLVFFGLGPGANGKSVMFSTHLHVLGDYAWTAPQSLLKYDPRRSATNDIAGMKGKRLVITSEVLSTDNIDEARLKALSGGDKINSRLLYQEFSPFNPVAKLWLFLNHRPSARDDSYAFWRRIRLIPFERKFERHEQDPNLTQKLKSESAGILNWLIKGCLLWQKEGLEPTPKEVLTATQEYQIENDPLAEWLGERTIEEEGVRTRAGELYKDYREWGELNKFTDKELMNRTVFGKLLSDKYKKIKSGSIYYESIKLTTSLEDYLEDMKNKEELSKEDRDSLVSKNEAGGRVQGSLSETPLKHALHETLLDKSGETLPLASKTNQDYPKVGTITTGDD